MIAANNLVSHLSNYCYNTNTMRSRSIVRTYLLLTLFNTLAASFIWGINTLFLLDAGLSNLEAFAANAFFTAGMVLFEVPTGVVADTIGRRASYLMGTFTLAITTLLYLIMWQITAPFWAWALVSVGLGLGFTFFSGATEAWLVDALNFSKFKGNLESVFAKAQVVGGIAMLSGSVAGGVIAQMTNLGVPYVLRVVILLLTFVIAFWVMKDIGFAPESGRQYGRKMKKIFLTSIEHGLKNPPVKWMMLSAPFSAGVGIYVFYAMQPHLLNLYGDPEAYSIAGLAAAIVAGAQIVGGMLVPFFRRQFKKRTSALIFGGISSVVLLIGIGLANNFWLAIILLVGWAMIYSFEMPIRQAYLNGLIPSKQRATVLSFGSLMGSSGGVVIQPVLGKVADATSYGTSYIVSGVFQLAAVPFIFLARRQNPTSDPIEQDKV